MSNAEVNIHGWKLLFILVITTAILIFTQMNVHCKWTPVLNTIKITFVYIQGSSLYRMPDIFCWEVSIRRAVCADK